MLKMRTEYKEQDDDKPVDIEAVFKINILDANIFDTEDSLKEATAIAMNSKNVDSLLNLNNTINSLENEYSRDKIEFMFSQLAKTEPQIYSDIISFALTLISMTMLDRYTHIVRRIKDLPTNPIHIEDDQRGEE